MPPCTRRYPVWGNGKVLDIISVWGKEAVQSQLCSSHSNYNTFGQISRDMMERVHDQDALQCRIKAKELRNAYHKACKTNDHSAAAPTTCHFYKKLDAMLGGDLTSTPSTSMDTSELSSTRQEEEEEQSGSKSAEAEEGISESLDACSQELVSSQEEGSQSWRPVLGEGQTSEEVPDATLRSQPSVLSPAKRHQRIRKRPRRSKEDMLHEVMQHSSNENQKVQEWQESERRILQQNQERRPLAAKHGLADKHNGAPSRLHPGTRSHAGRALLRPPPPCSPCPKILLCLRFTSNHFPQHLGSYHYQLPTTPVT